MILCGAGKGGAWLGAIQGAVLQTSGLSKGVDEEDEGGRTMCSFTGQGKGSSQFRKMKKIDHN